MPNRFTADLDNADVLSSYDSYERINWRSIPDDLYILASQFADSAYGDISELTKEFAARTLFLCFLAEMSDEDLKQCFGV